MNLYGHQNGKDGFVFSLSMTLTCTFRRIYDRVKIPLCKNYNLQECKSSLIWVQICFRVLFKGGVLHVIGKLSYIYIIKLQIFIIFLTLLLINNILNILMFTPSPHIPRTLNKIYRYFALYLIL